MSIHKILSLFDGRKLHASFYASQFSKTGLQERMSAVASLFDFG